MNAEQWVNRFCYMLPSSGYWTAGPMSWPFLKHSSGTGRLRRQSLRGALFPTGEPRGRSGQTYTTPSDLPGEFVLPVATTLRLIMV